MLSQREMLNREFRSVSKDAAEEQHQDTNQAHFTASENLIRSLGTITAVLRASIRNSFLDSDYGIFGMDSQFAIVLPRAVYGPCGWNSYCSF